MQKLFFFVRRASSRGKILFECTRTSHYDLWHNLSRYIVASHLFMSIIWKLHGAWLHAPTWQCNKKIMTSQDNGVQRNYRDVHILVRGSICALCNVIEIPHKQQVFNYVNVFSDSFYMKHNTRKPAYFKTGYIFIFYYIYCVNKLHWLLINLQEVV